MAMTIWLGSQRAPGVWPTEIRLRDVTFTRRTKVAKLLALLKWGPVVEVKPEVPG